MAAIRTQKVLVQWLPTEDLQIERRLTIGNKAGAEVQQESITLYKHRDLFPLAFALALPRSDGLSTLQVGFCGSTHFDGSGWVLDGPASPALPGSALIYFSEPPSLEDLVKLAEEETTLAPERLAARKIAMRRICEKLWEDHLKAVADEVRDRMPSPFFSVETFNRIARVYEEQGHGDFAGAFLTEEDTGEGIEAAPNTLTPSGEPEPEPLAGA